MSQIILNNQSASPDTPASGKVKIYAKTDKTLYLKDDTGAESQLSGEVLARKPAGYIDGLILEYVDAATIKINIGSCRDEDDSQNISLASSQNVALTTSGENGLDQGSEAGDTWYYVWIIYNPTTDTTSGLLSTSSTSPYMPSGFTKKRRIGSFRNDSASDILLFYCFGTGKERKYTYDQNQTVLSGGSSTSYADVDCSSFVPGTSTLMYLSGFCVRTGAVFKLDWRKKGSSADCQHRNQGYYRAIIESITETDDSQVIEYKVNNALETCTMKVIGYWEFL